MVWCVAQCHCKTVDMISGHRSLMFVLCVTIGATINMDDTDAPEAILFFNMFERIGTYQRMIAQRLSNVAKTEEQKAALRALRPLAVGQFSEQRMPDTSVNCVGCQAAFVIAPFLFRDIGVSIADLRIPVTFICQLIFRLIYQDNPYVGDMICKNVVNSYGPHVETIARKLQMNPQDSCYMLLYCTNNLESLDIPSLVKQLVGQSSIPFQDELAPVPFLSLHNIKPHPQTPKRLRRQVNLLRVVQLSDIHIDPLYREGAYSEDCDLPLCCHELPSYWPNGKGSAGPYGAYKCNVPFGTLKAFTEKLKTLNPDIVLHSGDSPSNTVWLETLDGQLSGTKWVARELKNSFPNVLGIYSVIGNHETFPTNMYHMGHPDTELLNQVFFDEYKNLSHFTSEQEATIKYSGYYSILIKTGLRMLAINSLFGEISNWYNIINRMEPEYNNMLQFTRTTLYNARRNNEKVIFMTHHPVGSNARDFDEDFTSIINEYHDVIVLNVAGHKHADEFRIFRNDAGEAFSVQLLSQSSNSFTDVNPGARIYYLDDSTFELIDYDQYYLDVKKKDQAKVTFLYSAKQAYGMPDFSAQSMLDFAVRMKNDDVLFKKYYDNVKTQSGALGSCDGNCKINKLCVSVTSTIRHQESCVRHGLRTFSASENGKLKSVSGNLESVGGNPQNFSGNPQDFSENPQDFSENPQDFSENPQDFNENPQDFSENPQDFSENHQFSGGNQHNAGETQRNHQNLNGNQKKLAGSIRNSGHKVDTKAYRLFYYFAMLFLYGTVISPI